MFEDETLKHLLHTLILIKVCGIQEVVDARSLPITSIQNFCPCFDGGMEFGRLSLSL